MLVPREFKVSVAMSAKMVRRVLRAFKEMLDLREFKAHRVPPE